LDERKGSEMGVGEGIAIAGIWISLGISAFSLKEEVTQYILPAAILTAVIAIV
jgi:hypothetical protein